MDMFRRIDEAEFQRDFAVTRERIFGRQFWPGDEAFVDRSWREVPIPTTPFGWSGPGPERPSDFPPIEPYFSNYFEVLCLTLAEFGVDEVLVSRRTIYDTDTLPSPTVHEDWIFGSAGEEHFLVAPRVSVFKDIEKEATWSLQTYYTMFARNDSRWGIVCDDFHFNLTVLGGAPDFIETFYRIAGGERNVRAWLAYSLVGDEGGSSLPGGDGDIDSDFVRRLYQRVGWPLPNVWGFVFGNEDKVDWSWMLDDEGFPTK